MPLVAMLEVLLGTMARNLTLKRYTAIRLADSKPSLLTTWRLCACL